MPALMRARPPTVGPPAQAPATPHKLSEIEMWNGNKRLQTLVADVAPNTITIRSLDWDRDRWGYRDAAAGTLREWLAPLLQGRCACGRPRWLQGRCGRGAACRACPDSPRIFLAHSNTGRQTAR